ncbi:MAG: MBL fold metallo-hydrolase [Myxococcota bacterium]
MSPSGALQFRVLGAGTAKAHPDRGPAGFVVTHRGRDFLVDGGSGTLQRLAKAGIEPNELAGGVYSHRHIDHTGDFVPLLFSFCVPPKRAAAYPVWAGTGFSAFYAQLQEIYGRWIQPAGGIHIHEHSLSTTTRSDLGQGLTLVTAPANHSAGALHLRFETSECAVVFSGDTGPSDALAQLATGADLLVTECAGSDAQPIPGHLTPSSVLDLLERSQPKQAWVTHLYGHVDRAQALATLRRAGVPVRLASDGDLWATPTR